jgi:glycosyltransferase involved in cell wall biosynthesis
VPHYLRALSGTAPWRSLSTSFARAGANRGNAVKDGARVVVVMPAYNAARTLEATYRGLAMDVVDEVILVDDVSHDETVEIAERLGLKVVVHQQNCGYGGNQKTCYLEALRSGADVVVMVHPDNQYDSTLVPVMVEPILARRADIVLGSRLLSGTALSGGMPLWRYVANRFLTWVENLAFGLRVSEYHTGFRAYSRRLLETVPFLLNSDDFVFDQEIMAQAVCFGFRVAEIPVPTRYFPEASSVNFRRSVEYGINVLALVGKYLLHRARIVRYPLLSAQPGDLLAPRHHQAILRGANRPR